MGLIKAGISAISGTLSDQWLDAIQPFNMSNQTIMTYGTTNPDSHNGSSSGLVITNGSKIQVYDNQLMILVDGGKIIDYTAEAGYYTVDNSSEPSIFNGQFGEVLQDAFNRFKFGGGTPQNQKVYYLNLQEIRGIKFGTKNPVSYYDFELDADLYIRAHGSYSIKICNPILFYKQVIPRNLDYVDINCVNQQFLNEFTSALQSSINQMSSDGLSIRRVASQSMALSKYMATALDDDWRVSRGFEVQSVGMEVSYDEQTKELFKMRSQGAMLKDANIREGYVQGAVARGIESAGSNSSGAINGFVGVGMQSANIASFSHTNNAQMNSNIPNTPTNADADKWTCSCSVSNAGKFCTDCGKPKPVSNSWNCSCGSLNTGKFCQNCGKSCGKIKCDKCGFEPDITKSAPKFCPECGDVIDENDKLV